MSTKDKIKDQIYLRDLANYPIILPAEGSALREIIVTEFKDKNIPLNVCLESVDPSTAKSMVERGIGGAFISLDKIHQDVQQGRFRVAEIIDAIYYYFDLIYLKERRNSKSVRSIISAIDQSKLDDPALVGKRIDPIRNVEIYRKTR